MTPQEIATLTDAPVLPSGWTWKQANTDQWAPVQPGEEHPGHFPPRKIPATGIEDCTSLYAAGPWVQGPRGSYPERIRGTATWLVESRQWLEQEPAEIDASISESDRQVEASIAAGTYVPWGTAIVWGERA